MDLAVEDKKGKKNQKKTILTFMKMNEEVSMNRININIKRKVILLFFMGAFLLSHGWGWGAIPSQERAAIIALYNSTDGDNWQRKTNWKGNNNEPDGFSQIGSEGTWEGVKVENDHVVQLTLGWNNMTGPLPTELGSLPQLSKLEFPSNHISGSIPATLGNLGNLSNISLINNQLSGYIPPELGNLVKLSWLELTNNNLSGAIPSQLGNLAALEYLYMQNNDLTGTIPAEFKKLQNLQALVLLNNQLSGSIPKELGQMASLRVLYLGGNELSGTVPIELGNLSKLVALALESNHFSGKIPSQIGNLTNLGLLKLQGNDFIGDIPPSFKNLSNLEELDLSNNRLSGVIPPGLGDIDWLWYVDLGSNGLSGQIPTDFTHFKGANPLKKKAGKDIFMYLFVGYNALYSVNPEVIEFMDDNSNGWNLTQTEAPKNVSAQASSMSSITISWTPIQYQAAPGGYRVYYRTTPSGSWKVAGTAAPKTASSFEMTGATPGITYYFGIRAWTDPHIKNKNIVYSNFSETATAAISGEAIIVLNPNHLSFTANTTLPPPPSQTFSVTNSGTGELNWTASVDKSWLKITPSSGTAGTEIQVSIDHTGLSLNTYTGNIIVTGPQAVNSPQKITVYLTVTRGTVNQPPFGYFDTPADGAAVSGSIAVSGWALDDSGIQHLKIYREPVTGETGSLVYIGDAVFVEGARPDIEKKYPYYPMSTKAGWGYMLLTNALPGKGSGTFILHAIVRDDEGSETSLGTKTIICDNANAVKPFGAIDTPTQGGIASGKSYVNFGWALTPPPNAIPTDGSTIRVWVDGKPLGHPVYNLFRQDIAQFFPGYANSDGAGGYYTLNTTTYTDGVHTIGWSAKDDAGNEDGIGSRFFTIHNSTSAPAPGLSSTARNLLVKDLTESAVAGLQKTFDYNSYRDLFNIESRVMVKKGFNDEDNSEALEIVPDENGVTRIEINELERVEIHLSGEETFNGRTKTGNPQPGNSRKHRFSGYMIVGDELRALPIGSTLDTDRGIFYWQPGPGFVGEYDFIFIEEIGNGSSPEGIKESHRGHRDHRGEDNGSSILGIKARIVIGERPMI